MKRSLAHHLALLCAALAFCLPATPALAADASSMPEPGVEGTDADAEDEITEVDPLDDGIALPAPIDALPEQELSAETLHDFLLAEIAGARGQTKLSAQTYIDLARKTRDPRIARRAAQFASQTRDNRLIVEAARLWLETAPESGEARQFAEYAEHGRSPALNKAQALLARALAQDPAKLAPNLMGLNRALSKADDKDAVRSVVFHLTEPYLAHPEAHFARAQAALLAKRPMEATGALDKALELRANWLPALMLKAHLLIESGAADKASQILQEARMREPDNRELRLAYARSLIVSRQYNAARAEFNGLLASAPGDRDLLYTVAMLSAELGDTITAEPLLKKALATGHPQADLIRIQLGKIASDQGDHAAARKWFDAVSPGGHSTEARIQSARSLAKEGRLDQARRLLQQNALNPEAQRRFLFAESLLLVEAGRVQQAFILINKALRTHPDDSDLLYESAMLAERIKQYDTMEARLRKLIALAPEHAHAYNALGYSLADRGIRLDEAEKLIARALEFLPQDAFILDSMGWVRFKRGDLPGALEQLEEAHSLRADPEIAAHLGEVLWRLKRSDDARRILDAAKTAHPDNTTVQNTIRRLFRSGKKR